MYFDNGATTFPKPKKVIDKLIEATTKYGANPGRSGHHLSLMMDREIFRARESVTNLIHGEDCFNTIFTYNCTDALNMAIKGSIKDPCHVITTAMEHNSVLRPLFQLKKQGIIDLTVVSADGKGRVNPQDMEKAIGKETKLCVMTAMSNLTGTIMDYREIGQIMKDHDIRFIIDGAQALGYLDINMTKDPVDILCFAGHKGLYGPQGTGGLYFKPGVEINSFREGGTGSKSTELLQPSMSPDKFEAGTANGPGIVALGAGCEFVMETGIDNIKEHENRLKNKMIERLRDRENIILYGPLDENQGPVISMNIESMDSSIFAMELDRRYNIATRAGIHCAPLAHKALGTVEKGAVRFSFSYFNTMDEVEQAIDAVLELSEEKA